MDALRALGSSERSIEAVLKGLDIVCTLLSNVVEVPGEPKYRRVKKANPRIAPLLGCEEEGVLRAAGFEDSPDGDSLTCCIGEAEGWAPAQLGEVLAAATAVRQALRHCLELEDLQAAASTSTSSLLCREPRVAERLECAVLDFAAQQSADLALAEKRRRRSDEALAVRSPTLWREAFMGIGGAFLCDGGPLEAWLQADARHRNLAHDLLELQAAAMRWYGAAAKRHCEAWRLDLVHTDLNAKRPFEELLRAELLKLQEAIFEFPERPGAPPLLFRSSPEETPEVCSSDCMVMPEVPRAEGQASEVLLLEE